MKQVRIRRRGAGLVMVAGMVIVMSGSALAYPLQDAGSTESPKQKSTNTEYTDGIVGASQHKPATAQYTDGFAGASQRQPVSIECALPARLRSVEGELCTRGTVSVPEVQEVEFRPVEAPTTVPAEGFNMQWIAVAAGAIALLGLAALSIRMYPGHTGGRDWL